MASISQTYDLHVGLGNNQKLAVKAAPLQNHRLVLPVHHGIATTDLVRPRVHAWPNTAKRVCRGQSSPLSESLDGVCRAIAAFQCCRASNAAFRPLHNKERLTLTGNSRTHHLVTQQSPPPSLSVNVFRQL